MRQLGWLAHLQRIRDDRTAKEMYEARRHKIGRPSKVC